MKKCAIDARMIESSGIGTYIQHLLNCDLYEYAIGDLETIRKYDEKIKVIQFTSSIYGLKGQVLFPFFKLWHSGVRVIHFPHYNVPLFCPMKYVVTVHDIIHLLFPKFLGGKIKQLYSRLLMYHSIKSSQKVFTDSNNSKNDIIRYFNIPENKITITYMAVDSEFVTKSRMSIEYLYDMYSIPRNKKILLYVGNMNFHKNLVRLLYAFSMFDNVQDYCLVLAGKAFKNSDILKSKEKELGLNDYVVHTGFILKENLVDLYNLADVFVFPSLYEGFGIPPLEAMACGTPVVCSNNSSLPEVVGNAAILFNPYDPVSIYDAIQKCLYENGKLELLVKNGYERVKCFKWDNSVECIRNVLMDL